jgi:hypothetical protein
MGERTAGQKLRSHRLEVFESLAGNDPIGLTIPELAKASGVPKSTVHRIVSDFRARGILVEVGKKRKAPILRVNVGDPEVTDLASTLNQYTLLCLERESLEHLSRAGLRREEGDFVLGTDIEVTFQVPDLSPAKADVSRPQFAAKVLSSA